MGTRGSEADPGQKQRSSRQGWIPGPRLEQSWGWPGLGPAPESPLSPFPGYKQRSVVGGEQTVLSPTERAGSILGDGGRKGPFPGPRGERWPDWRPSRRSLASLALWWPTGRTAWCRAHFNCRVLKRSQPEEGGRVLPSDDHRGVCLKGERSRGPSQRGEHLSRVFQSEETSLLFC